MWHVTCDTWHVTWHVTRDTWHVTHDTWHVWGGEHSLKISAPQLLPFVIYDIMKIWRMNHWINEWNNHEAAYRTALATPGLLNRKSRNSMKSIQSRRCRKSSKSKKSRNIRKSRKSRLRLELTPWSSVPPSNFLLKSGFLKKTFLLEKMWEFFWGRAKHTYSQQNM